MFKYSVVCVALLLFDATTGFTPVNPLQCEARRTKKLLSSADDDADKLRERAAKLREEVEIIESQKRSVELEDIRKQEEERAAQNALKERYSARVPILKPDGTTVEERCDFRPRWNVSSFITVCEASLPLGIILGESEKFNGAVEIDQIAEGSNGEMAGVKVGDLLRACTATKMDMEAPAWQLIAGGIGIPKTKRFMYSVDYRPFEEVMEAVGSNRLDPEQRPVLLVVERLED